LVDLTDYKESLNVGGAVGSIYGATKITLGVEYQTDDLSQIAVGKNRAFPISVTLNGGNPTTNVGGLAGLAQNVGVNNLYANASITITDKTTAEYLIKLVIAQSSHTSFKNSIETRFELNILIG
jgi:hypothetical protein